MRILTYRVSPQDEGRALRSLIPQRFQLGNHAFRRLKVQQAILVNRHVARADYRVHVGDLIEVQLKSDGTISPSQSSALCTIRYIDEDLIVLSKGAPLATLPSCHVRTGTLREILAEMLGESPDTFCYHPVNRLDKGTSGLLVVARHDHAQRLLTEQLHTSSFVREYLAVTDGVPSEESGTLSLPIAHSGFGARRVIRQDGKPAVTHFEVVQHSGRHALLRLRLETGRTHQIRVHLAAMGCPVTGDYLYGTPLPELPDRFALHSARLALTQPITGKHIDISEPLPQQLSQLLDVADNFLPMSTPMADAIMSPRVQPEESPRQ